jgi:alkylated DNA repair dioxygenase AlkB
MVRLEKIRLDVKSWWATADSAPLELERDLDAFKVESHVCQTCNEASKHIFNAGWACLHTACSQYFKFPEAVDEARLDYNEAFLKSRTKYGGGPLPPLAPPLLTQEDLEGMDASGTEVVCKRGIVCPQCNACSRRIEWSGWTCETKGCGFTYSIPKKTVSVHDAISQDILQNSETLRLREFHNSDFGIVFEQKIMGQYDIFEYHMPGPGGEIVGVVRHFKASGLINCQPDGPNDLFRMMQEDDFNMRRLPARQSGGVGEVLTSHWVSNWGAPYKYGVSVESKGFQDAPIAIVKALKRLTWAGQQTMDDRLEPFHPFNELLSLGYFEETSIGYHDDGESTLGLTVATLSLGAQASMTFRPKAKSGFGATSKNAKGTKPDVLRITLEHGDMIIMHGTGVQKLYEHAVTPHGKLRFALTCRYIRPETMNSDYDREQTLIKSTLPEGHEQYDYDGDINSKFVVEPEASAAQNASAKVVNSIVAAARAGILGPQDVMQIVACLDGVKKLFYFPPELFERRRTEEDQESTN